MISRCRACKSSSITPVWKLADSPYGDSFTLSKSVSLAAKFHTMTLALCGDCTLVQLLEETDLEVQYDDYLYTTSTTFGLSRFYNQVVERLIHEYDLRPNELTVIDIGSNDGSFLNGFHERGFKVLGIEPSKQSAQIANERGINTLNTYYTEKVAAEILQEKVHPQLISINYTLANVPDVLNFFGAVSKIMGKETVLSVITGYHPDQFGVNMFDYIGHDHLSYFSVNSIHILCESLGLKLIEVIRVEHKGGSIQLIMKRQDSMHEVQPSVNQMLQRETWMNINDIEFYQSLAMRIQFASEQVNTILAEIPGRVVSGIGASISTTYLCNQFQLADRLSKLYDDDKNKIGRFAPGSGLEVFPLDNVGESTDELLILLAWQHTSKLLSRLKECQFQGDVLVPLPTPKLIKV
jgi:hypothetical protein